MVFNDKFVNLDNWQHDAGIEISGGEVVNTAASSQWAWKVLETPLDTSKPFRLSTRVFIGDVSFWVGFANGTVGDNPSTFTNADILYGGYTNLNTRLQWRYSQSISSIGGDILSGYKRISIVSDGDTVTFTVCDDDNNVIVWEGRYKAAKATYNHLVIRFFNTGTSKVDTFSFADSWNQFGDADLEDEIKAVIMKDSVTPGSVSAAENRSFVVIPKLTNDKHRLILYSHGYLGNWTATIGSTRMHYSSEMAKRGYCVVSLDGGGNHNGHWTVTTQAYKVRQKLMSILKFHHKVFTVGHSMGALFALNFAKDYPDMVSRICLLGGHTNLLWRYYGFYGVERSSSINGQYNCNEATFLYATRGRNPYEYFNTFAKYPILAIHAELETIVEEKFTVDLVNNINALGGDATYLKLAGSSDHSDPMHWDSDAHEPFFNLSSDEDLGKPSNALSNMSGTVRIS